MTRPHVTIYRVHIATPGAAHGLGDIAALLDMLRYEGARVAAWDHDSTPPPAGRGGLIVTIASEQYVPERWASFGITPEVASTAAVLRAWGVATLADATRQISALNDAAAAANGAGVAFRLALPATIDAATLDAITRKRPDVQPCGERHAPYIHCLTCNPPPPENPDRLQGPEIGPEYIYRSKSFPDGVRVVVTARSYVWAPGDPAYHGGARHYDWKCIRILDGQALPPFFGGRGLCVDDSDLSPTPEATA